MTDNPLPLIDSLATVLSLAATYLLIINKTENWLLWIIADVLYIIMFFYQELFLSGALYLVFFVLAIIGFRRWKSTELTVTSL